MCEVSSCRHSAYLTDIRRNDSAGFGLCVERVPVAYHHNAGKKSVAKKKSESKKVCQSQIYKAVPQDKILTI
jgi:hypothetical protein